MTVFMRNLNRSTCYEVPTGWVLKEPSTTEFTLILAYPLLKTIVAFKIKISFSYLA